MSDPFTSAWNESGGDPKAALDAWFAERDGRPSTEAAPVGPGDKSPPPGDLRNPLRRRDDPSLAALSRLSISELDELEAVTGSLVDRLLRADAWDARRRDDEGEAERRAEEAGLAADPDANERAAYEADLKTFRMRYWSLAPSERTSEAARLGIDLEGFEPPSHFFDATIKETQ